MPLAVDQGNPVLSLNSKLLYLTQMEKLLATLTSFSSKDSTDYIIITVDMDQEDFKYYL